MRGARRDIQSSAARAISAAGKSQLIWPPISEPNNRVRPAWPPNDGPAPFPKPSEGPAPFRKPTEPASFPVSLPSPL